MTNYDEMLLLDDVNFTETDAATIETELIELYQKTTKKILYPADPVRLFLCVLAYRLAHERLIYNNSGRQTLLRYATGNKLDHIGVITGTPRIGESYSKTVFKFTLSAVLGFNVVIPASTRGTTKDGSAIFSTDKEITILAGSISGEVEATSLIAGGVNNDIQIGEINTIVDPIAYVVELENTSISNGGNNEEGDDDYRERISLAPEKFSTAGSELAYQYHALSAHQNVSSVETELLEPGVVQVIVLLKNGVIPALNSVEIMAVKEMLNDEKIRPLTDTVDVIPAQAVNIDYSITWYLHKSLSSLSQSISREIEKAVDNYEIWQTTELGRDINPDELISQCKAAGAKRIEINGLNYQSLTKRQVCQFSINKNRINYGGTEGGN